MYAKLKAMSAHHHDGQHNPGKGKVESFRNKVSIQYFTEVEYLVPKNHEDFYKLCPAPRPVNLKLSTPPNTPSTSSSSDLMGPSGYTPMHTPTIKGKLKYFTSLVTS